VPRVRARYLRRGRRRLRRRSRRRPGRNQSRLQRRFHRSPSRRRLLSLRNKKTRPHHLHPRQIHHPRQYKILQPQRARRPRKPSPRCLSSTLHAHGRAQRTLSRVLRSSPCVYLRSYYVYGHSWLVFHKHSKSRLPRCPRSSRHRSRPRCSRRSSTRSARRSLAQTRTR
jgi:hypothetical protein